MDGHTVSDFWYYNDAFVLLWHIQVHAELDVSQPNFLFVVWCKINSENDSSTCNKRQTYCSVLYACWQFLHTSHLHILSNDQYVARPTLGCISSSFWICIWHDEKKYIAQTHLFGPSIRWNELWRLINRTDCFFQISGQVMSQQCTLIIYQFQKTYATWLLSIQPQSYAWELWQQLLIYGHQKICDSLCQFAPVITSLRQLVTVTLPTLINIHIAKPNAIHDALDLHYKAPFHPYKVIKRSILIKSSLWQST